MKGRDKGLECGTTEGALQPWSGACLGASCSERCGGAAGDQCLGFTIRVRLKGFIGATIWDL